MSSFEETNHPGYDEVFKKKSSKQHEFSLFKSIGDYFNHRQQSKNVTDLIDSNLLVTVLNEIKNGYQLTLKQDSLLEEKITKKINDFSYIESLLENKIEFPTKYVAIFCIKNAQQINPEFALFKKINKKDLLYPHITKWLTTYKENKKLGSILFDYMIIKMKDILKVSKEHDFRFYDNISEPLMFLEYHDFLDNIAKEKKETTMLLLKSLIKRYPHEHFVSDIETFMDKVQKSLDKTNNIVPQLPTKETESLNKILSSLDIKKLPQEIIEEINKIKENHVQLMAHKETLNNEQQFNVKNLYHNKLPEVISQYVSFNEQYVNEIKNIEGKNATQILKETLTDINEIFTHMVNQINEVNVSDLNVTNRYLNEVKNRL